MTSAKPIVFLMADDDADDRMLTKEALEESRVLNELRFVEDGEELMDYLAQRGKFSDPGSAPRPSVIRWTDPAGNGPGAPPTSSS